MTIGNLTLRFTKNIILKIYRDLLIHTFFKNLRDVWKDTNRSIVVFIGPAVLFLNTGGISAAFKMDREMIFFKQVLNTECNTKYVYLV